MSYGGQLAGSSAASPEEIAQQQARWEKERAENAKSAYQSQLAHAALALLAGHNGGTYDAVTALDRAHNVIQGAKKYNP